MRSFTSSITSFATLALVAVAQFMTAPAHGQAACTNPLPGAGNCFVATDDVPGCTALACCQAVCACDEFCCETEWDIFCATTGFGGSGCGAGVLCLGGGGDGLTVVSSGPVLVPGTGTGGAGALSLGGPYPSNIIVSGGPDNITSIRVRLCGIYHTFPDDMDVLLVGPNGGKVMLMSDAGGGNDVGNLSLIFDDAAAANLPDATQISGGTFRPTDFEVAATDEMLAPAPAGPYGTNLGTTFNGIDSNGTWSLYVRDDAGGDLGIINQWAISFNGEPFPDCAAPLVANENCNGVVPELTCGVPVLGTLVGAFDDYRLSGAACFTGVGQTTTTAVGRDVVYRFTPPVSGTYSFKAQNLAAGANLVLYVASACTTPPNGLPVNVTTCLGAANHNAATGALIASEEVMCLSLLGGVQVFVYVDESAAVSATTAPFILDVSACSRETEPNGTPATASVFGQGIENSITPASEVDFFSLGSPAAGARLFAAVFSMSASNADSVLRATTATDTLETDLDDGDTTTLGATASVLGGTPMTGVPTFLRVNQNAAVITEPWRIFSVVQPAIGSAIAESEGNDTTATADSHPSNYFTGSVSPAAENDHFSFTAGVGDTIFIGLDNDPLRDATPFNGNVALLDSAGTVLLMAADANAASSTVSGVGSLTSATPNSPGEAILFRVPAGGGGTFFARVTSAATGDYLLSISVIPASCAPGAIPPPPNDNCAAQQALTSGVTATGSTQFATNDGSASCDPGGASSQDLWYSFTLASAMTPIQVLTVDTCGSAIDTTVAVFTGTCGALTEIGCNDTCGGAPCGGPSSCLSFTGLAAGTYIIRVSDKGLTGGSISVTARLGLANDLCTGAIPITCPSATAGTTVGATLDAGLPDCTSVSPSPANITGGSIAVTAPGVWYSIVGNGNTVIADTLVASYDTKIHVYTGPNCSTLTCVTANDDISNVGATQFRSKVAFQTVSGQTYFIMVNGFGTTTGTFTLNVVCEPTPVNDLCSMPTIIGPSNGSLGGTLAGATGAGFSPTSSVLASCATNVNEPLFDVWYSYTAPCTGSLAIDTCGAFDTLLSVHTACPTLTLGNQFTPTSATCNDNGPAGCTPGSSLGAVPVVGGTTYLIRVAGAMGIQPGAPFTITWSLADTTAPTIACPSSVIAGTSSGCSGVATWTVPTASDNCAVVSLTSTHQPGDLFSKGITVVTYTALDQRANSATCSFTVTIVDDDPPSISCPTNVTANTDPNQCSAVVNWANPTVSDNCPNDLSFAQTGGPLNGSAVPVGVNTITYTVTDRGGNTATCAFTVTVLDTQAPTITCPSAATVGTNVGCTAVGAAIGSPTASDNCPGVTISNNAPGALPLGATVVTWTATDASGNTATCAQTVTVIDDDAPVITLCAPNTNVNEPLIPDLTGAVAATDSCSPVTVTQSPAAGSTITVTPTTVTFTVADAAGNTATCTALVTLVGALPPTMSLDANPSCAGLGESVKITLSMENLCPLLTNGFQAFLEFDPSVLQFEGGFYTAAPFGLPIITPITAVGGNIDLAAGINQFTGQTSTCADAALVSLEFTVLVEDCGTTAVAFRPHLPPTRFTDPFGNEIPGVLLDDDGAVITLDGTAPTVTSCPSNFNVNAQAGTCTAVFTAAQLTPTATDLCDESLTATFVRSDGQAVLTAPFPCGAPTTVTWTIADDCGNSSTCSFTVTVACMNQLTVNLQLSPTMQTGPLTRCITFELWDCVGAGPDATVSQTISFFNGSANGVAVLVPCGSYTCVTARDRHHSTRRTASLSAVFNDYIASFIGPDQLVGGNLNDDGFIDVLDFGVFVSQFGANYGSIHTTCSTVFPHADINGDAFVGLNDFTFIQINFLVLSEADCCGAPALLAGAPVSKISVAELHERGLGHLAVADLNQDGMLDEGDMAAFAGGVTPTPHTFTGLAGASWFDSRNWVGGLPDSSDAVTLDGIVHVDQAGAEVGSLTIAAGGSLSLTGTLSAVNLTLNDGAILMLDDAAASLSVENITVEPGATILWRQGVIHGQLVNGGLIVMSPAQLTLEGSLIQTSQGELAFELAGAELHASLSVTELADLAGTLTLLSTRGYEAQVGQSLALLSAAQITGGFEASSLPAIAAGADASLSQSDVALGLTITADSPVTGDLNGDQLVNGVDLGLLLASWGSCTPCAADLDGSGEVDGLDMGILLAAWPQ